MAEVSFGFSGLWLSVDVAVVGTVAEQTDVLLIAKGLELCLHLEAAGFIFYLLNCSMMEINNRISIEMENS